IHMEIGRPWFDTPLHIKEAAKRALDLGYVHYSPNRGLLELRQALARKLARDNGIVADPEREILVTTGNKQATFFTMMCLVEPGDEVVVTDPAYSPHYKEISFVGGTPKFVRLPRDGWRLDAAALRAQISDRTKLIFLNTPHNPTGRVFSEAELAAVADVARERDLLVLTDETYEYIVYDGHRQRSMATFPGMRERTISTFAFTKSYAMDGWRVGYLTAPAPLIDAMVKIVQLDTAGPNTFAQWGAIAAVDGGTAVVDEMVAQDRAGRDLITRRLTALGFPTPVVEGTIHVLADFSALDPSSDRAARLLLERAHVATTPGIAYGPAAEGLVRFSFGAVPPPELDEALDNIARLGR
ncbi:MAG: aminotransferase class I/II-fold pyridoxal phosphate-dependent enzyme, partial [Armatimonadetes bacterium]|nr:aminotransferase class I/II-fold pyridoxal phosphate-dependent enzyme [Armatimonadota bacterium]